MQKFLTLGMPSLVMTVHANSTVYRAQFVHIYTVLIGYP